MLKINTLNEIQHYLESNYLTIEQMSLQTNIAIKRIQLFIDASCIPKHSHQMNHQVVFHTDIFGSTVISTHEVLYYHPSLIHWINVANHYANTSCLSDVAIKMKIDFTEELRQVLLEIEGTQHVFNACFDNNGNLLESGVDNLILENWPYIMNGTYGVCLKWISAKNMIIKLMSVSLLQKWLDSETTSQNDQYQQISKIAEMYNSVATAFGPHEIDKSTRGRLFNRYKSFVKHE